MDAPPRTDRSASWPELTRSSATRARLLARAPRVLGCLTLVVLAAVGLRALIAPSERTAAPAPAPFLLDSTASHGLAESFARTYLAWDPADPEGRRSALVALGGTVLGEGAGLSPPSGGKRAIAWSAVVAERPGPAGATVMTVAAAAPGEPALHLAVPIRTEEGRPALAGPPSLVGPPAPAPGHAPPEGDPIEDDALVGVARRALSNYLHADRDNLLADLAPGAVLSLPGRPLPGARIGEPRWLERSAGWVGVPVEVRVAGARAELRYLLRVRHEGRWLVGELAG